MKYLKKIIYLIVVCCLLSYLYLMFFSTYEVKYDLTDCVRYFDTQGRYRLMLVGDIYFFVDAEHEHKQIANIKKYYYDNDIFYGICSTAEKQMYFIFNTDNEKSVETNDINALSASDIYILESDNMIELEKPNQFQKYFRKFIPLKYRKK